MLEIRGEATQPNYIQQIESSPGLYFDYLGKLKTKNGQLDTLIPIDISHLQPHISNIKSALDTTIKLCTNSGRMESLECYNMLEPLSVLYHDMVKQFTSISHLIDNRKRRSAWIGGIGTAFKQVFGTLDEDDGIRFSEAIEIVQNDQKKLASLVKQNILVTTSVISYFNGTLDKIKTNEAKFSQAIDKLSNGLENITLKTDELLLQSYEIQILNSLQTAILTVSFQIEDLINGILFSSQNILHPSILNPQQLYKELADSYRHLPDNVKLPVEY